MNDLIRKLALDAHLLNYIDLETPRHYFISGNADMEDVEKFAELIVRGCLLRREFIQNSRWCVKNSFWN